MQNHQRRQPEHQGSLISLMTNEQLRADNWDLRLMISQTALP